VLNECLSDEREKWMKRDSEKSNFYLRLEDLFP
jgi:hypothetical protein